MEVFTSFTDDNASTKEMGAENPSLSQQCKPTTQWVRTLGVTSSPQEIRCSFLADRRAETPQVKRGKV